MAEMDMLNDPMILRELIMDHYQFPHNHGLIKDEQGYTGKHMASDSCIDDAGQNFPRTDRGYPL